MGTPAAPESRVVRAFVGYFAKSRSYDHDYLEIAGKPIASMFLLVPEAQAGVPPREYLARRNGLAELIRELAAPGDDLFLHSRRAPQEDVAPPSPEVFDHESDGYIFDYAAAPSMFDTQTLRWRRLAEIVGQVTVLGRYSDDEEINQAGPSGVGKTLCRILSARRSAAELSAALSRISARRGERIEEVRGRERLPLWRPW